MNRHSSSPFVVTAASLMAIVLAGALHYTSAQAPGANVAQGTDGLGALLPPGGARPRRRRA